MRLLSELLLALVTGEPLIRDEGGWLAAQLLRSLRRESALWQTVDMQIRITPHEEARMLAAL